MVFQQLFIAISVEYNTVNITILLYTCTQLDVVSKFHIEDNSYYGTISFNFKPPGGSHTNEYFWCVSESDMKVVIQQEDSIKYNCHVFSRQLAQDCSSKPNAL